MWGFLYKKRAPPNKFSGALLSVSAQPDPWDQGIRSNPPLLAKFLLHFFVLLISSIIIKYVIQKK